MKKAQNIIWGLVLIAAGVIFALNSFEIVNIDLFFDGWWTLFIIIPSIVGIFTEPKKLGNITWLAFGVILLLCCRDVISFDILWKLLPAIIIVLLGAKMIYKAIRIRKAPQPREFEGHINIDTAIFAGHEINYNGKVFEGAKLVAVFGGTELDLRSAIIEKDCSIRAVGIFGGVDILLPSNVNVEVFSTSVFGGVSNKKSNSQSNTVTVYVDATGLFGGVDIE